MHENKNIAIKTEKKTAKEERRDTEASYRIVILLLLFCCVCHFYDRINIWPIKCNISELKYQFWTLTLSLSTIPLWIIRKSPLSFLRRWLSARCFLHDFQWAHCCACIWVLVLEISSSSSSLFPKSSVFADFSFVFIVFANLCTLSRRKFSLQFFQHTQ